MTYPPRGYRTPVFIRPQIRAVIDMLDNIKPDPDDPFPIGNWTRPKDLDTMKFKEPPYLLARVYPSADQMTGSLDDTQLDQIIRLQLIGYGHTETEALDVCDWAHQHMQRSNLEPYLLPHGRAVMDLRRMVSSAGQTRDDDLPTPYYASGDLYELRTTRARNFS